MDAFERTAGLYSPLPNIRPFRDILTRVLITAHEAETMGRVLNSMLIDGLRLMTLSRSTVFQSRIPFAIIPHHVPTPISTAPMDPDLPSAVPILESFAAQEPSQDQIPQSPSTARPFRTPPRTRTAQSSRNEASDVMDGRIPSVPATPGSFRSKRRREGWTVRRVSERVEERDGDRGRSQTLAGDAQIGDEAPDTDRGYATFPPPNGPYSARRRSLRTPSTARSTYESDAEEDAPLERFTLPSRVFKAISRQASGVFVAGGFGRGSRAPSVRSEEREEGVRMWYS